LKSKIKKEREIKYKASKRNITSVKEFVTSL